MENFTTGYITCAIWSSCDDSGNPLDQMNTELSSETRMQMEEDCKAFEETNTALLEQWYAECGESPDRAGHDFWLTRNHHGAGFWDRWNGATPQGKVGQALTESAHAFGESYLYLGSDGLIHCQ